MVCLSGHLGSLAMSQIAAIWYDSKHIDGTVNPIEAYGTYPEDCTHWELNRYPAFDNFNQVKSIYINQM